MKGIITKQAEGGDGTRLLSIFTEEQGIIRAKARCSKKSLTGTQFLCYGDFELFGNKAIRTVDTVSPIDTFSDLQADIEKLALATYLSDCLFTFIQYENPEPEGYSLFLNSIYALSHLSTPPLKVKAVFEARMLRIAGFMPDKDSFDCGVESFKAFYYAALCDGKKLYAFDISDEGQEEFSSIAEIKMIEALGKTPKSLDYYKKVKG